jgi:hypothetical protein
MKTYPDNSPEDLICECGRHLPCRHCEPSGDGLGASTCSLDGVVREFVRLLDIEEESDSGRRFRPNGITSCRAIDGAKMVELIHEMKRLTENDQAQRSED